MFNKYYYITTTIPYVNADPHIGFALEITQADCLARYHRLLGKHVFHNFGSDEHGVKIYQKALESKKDPQTYVNENAEKFRNLKTALNLQYDAFIRTTDPKHIAAAQAFWKLCDKKGDVYKKNYKSKYCVGCEMEKTDSELINGFCEFHPGKPLEIHEEENYFFRFSKYEQSLLELYRDNPSFVVPENRLREIETFVKNGLKDFSISRLKSKMPWGVPVPGDEDHVMYVWFDALVNYISTLGWPEETQQYKNFWPGIQTAGKDNLRQQSAIWQAMLLSAGLPNTKQIFIHGFISVDGQKISKSLGNVVDPYDLISRFGTDALRYYLLREIPAYDDGNYSESRFKELYNADLANGLGNLVARVAKLATSVELDAPVKDFRNVAPADYQNALDQFRFHDALAILWDKIKTTDQFINEKQPWKLTGSALGEVLTFAIAEIVEIATLLQPFLPETAVKILTQFTGPTIKTQAPLFPRIQ